MILRGEIEGEGFRFILRGFQSIQCSDETTYFKLTSSIRSKNNRSRSYLDKSPILGGRVRTPLGPVLEPHKQVAAENKQKQSLL